MEPNHLFSLPLHANPCGLDPCLNQQFFVVPLTKTTLGVWTINSLHDDSHHKSIPKHFELEGHSKTINAITFTNGSQSQLASACSEKLLLWDLNFKNDIDTNPDIQSTMFFSKPGDVSVMTFNNDNNVAAVGNNDSILLLERGQMNSRLLAPVAVTGMKFCPHYTSTLVSISDDRTCSIWDIKDSLLLYQSCVLSPTPLLSLSMSLLSPCVVVGSGDGRLIAFDLTSKHDFRQLFNIDLPVVIRRKNQRISKEDGDCIEIASNYVEASESILSIEFVYFSQNSTSNDINFNGYNSAAGDMVEDIPPSLNIITTNHVLQMNSKTFEFQNMIKLQESIHSETFSSSVVVGSVSYAAAKQTNQFQMLMLTGTAFDRKIHVIEWCFLNEKFKSFTLGGESSNPADNELSDMYQDKELSIFAVTDLELDSPLKSEMLPPISKGTVTRGDIATGKKKPTSKLSQPLTFKSNVKSSGYTQAPRTTMFKPETSKQKLLNTSKPVKKSPANKTLTGKSLKSDCESLDFHVKEYMDSLEVDNQGATVLDLRFSEDGSSLACALSNKTAIVIKSPFSRGASTPFIGHNHQVNSVYWSNCNSYLLTSSNDKTVRLWDRSSGESLLFMTHKNQTFKEVQTPIANTLSPSASSSSHNQPFSKEITRAQFYFRDKFLLVTHGPDLLLYKYYVSHQVDDLKRYQSKNKYKMVHNWSCSHSAITSSVAVNNFFSHLVLCTTAGRSIEVYDMNKTTVCHSFQDCHSRPANSITINEGSCFSSQSSNAYNVFATISTSDPIKLWDLRSRSCVQALVGHKNKAHCCQIAFSPCGNYLATASEDRAVYNFDLRKGTFTDKLKGPTNATISVAFNPAKSLLAAGDLDGKVSWYR